jgi:hypothetical protein
LLRLLWRLFRLGLLGVESSDGNYGKEWGVRYDMMSSALIYPLTM